jgi:hypothetical protein
MSGKNFSEASLQEMRGWSRSPAEIFKGGERHHSLEERGTDLPTPLVQQVDREERAAALGVIP